MAMPMPMTMTMTMTMTMIMITIMMMMIMIIIRTTRRSAYEPAASGIEAIVIRHATNQAQSATCNITTSRETIHTDNEFKFWSLQLPAKSFTVMVFFCSRHLVLEEFWLARDQVVVHVRADQTDDRAVLIVEDEQRRAHFRTCSPW